MTSVQEYPNKTDHVPLIYNAIKVPRCYAVKVSEPLVSGKAITLPDCVKQTGMMPWNTSARTTKKLMNAANKIRNE